MLTQAERDYFLREQGRHEAGYLAGGTPREQSGFGLGPEDWERLRSPIAKHIHKAGSFLDIGCANGLLMESVVDWGRDKGHAIEPFGLDISEGLVGLAKRRLPQWRDRIFVGNAFLWDPPVGFDFVRAELVYVPPSRRREFIERLLDQFVTPGGRLILCSYGSSRPEGVRAELLVEQLRTWGFQPGQVEDAVSSEHGFVITRTLALEAPN